MFRPTLVAALVAVALHSGVSAQEPSSDVTIDGLNLGTYWYGTQISKKDLFGKVVLVEIWGS